MTENQATQKYVRFLNGLDLRVNYIVKEARLSRGHPDVIGCVDGTTHVIEAKGEKYWAKRKGQKLQLYRLRQWAAVGADAWWVVGKREWGCYVHYVLKWLEYPMIVNDTLRAGFHGKVRRFTKDADKDDWEGKWEAV